MAQCEFDKTFKTKVGLSKLEIQTKTEEITKDATLGATTGATNNLQPLLTSKQDTLVGKGVGQNIKTINGMNIMGQGDLVILPEGSINFEANVPTTPENTPFKSVKVNTETYDLDNYYATKKELNDEVNKGIETTTQCKDEVEITGYTGCSQGLAIDLEQGVGSEQLIKIPTIKGQTKRASENLLKFTNNTYNFNGLDIKVEDGIITMSGTLTSGGNCFIESSLNIPTNTYSLRYETNMVDKEFAIVISNAISDYSLSINAPIKRTTFKTQNDLTSLRFFFPDTLIGKPFNNLVLKISIYVGDYDLPFKPYNPNLVNSNNTLVSTGKQLWDEQWINGALNDNGEIIKPYDAVMSKNYINVLPNTRYSIHIKKDNVIYVACYDKNKDFIKNLNNDFTTPENCYYVLFQATQSYGTTYKNDIMFNYGTPINYEPYKENIIARCGELSGFDYIDNITNKKHINKGNTININSSVDWGVDRDYFYAKNIKFPTSKPNECSISNIPVYDNTGDLLNPRETLYITNSGVDYVEVSGLGKSLEEFKAFIDTQDIQLFFKAKDETIEDIIPALPNEMAVAVGGMQYQQPLLTNGVPYDITKIYSSTIRGQINANIETDVEQQKEIDTLISGLKNHDTKIKDNEDAITLINEVLNYKKYIEILLDYNEYNNWINNKGQLIKNVNIPMDVWSRAESYNIIVFNTPDGVNKLVRTITPDYKNNEDRKVFRSLVPLFTDDGMGENYDGLGYIEITINNVYQDNITSVIFTLYAIGK